MDKKKIIDKVIKLMALGSNNPSSAEALSAEAMAAKLMADYDIKASEVEKDDKKFFTEERMLGRKKIVGYNAMLYDVVSRFNGVAFLSKESIFGKGKIMFIGRKADIEVNDYMLDIVFSQRKKHWDEYRKKYKSLFGESPREKIRSDWSKNFAWGVGEKLKRITLEKNSIVEERGLVPINNRDQALKEFQEHTEVKTNRGVKGTNTIDGFRAGLSVNINKGVKE